MSTSLSTGVIQHTLTVYISVFCVYKFCKLVESISISCRCLIVAFAFDFDPWLVVVFVVPLE